MKVLIFRFNALTLSNLLSPSDATNPSYTMVGSWKGTNTYGKNKRITKKKILKKDEDVKNAHSIYMKGIIISEKFNGKSRGISPIVNPKEFKFKKLNKAVDHTPLYMSDQTDVSLGSRENINASKDPQNTTLHERFPD